MTSTKERLILVAERLFSARGFDGVSLRQIGTEAGNANTSAVQYHFGSKEGLIEAVLLYRLPQLNQRRVLLRQRVQPGDLRGLLEAYLLPVVEQAEIPDSHYLGFLQHFLAFGVGENPFDRLAPDMRAQQEGFDEEIGSALSNLPPVLRRARLRDVQQITLHVSADRERALRRAAPVAPFALQVCQLFDGLMGYLLAPASTETLAVVTSLSEDATTGAGA